MGSSKKSSRSIVRNAKKLFRFLEQKKTELSPLLILTHDYPDPDALASAYALQYLADKVFGIQSRIVYGGVIGRMENRSMARILKLPVHKLKAGELKKYDRVALIDTQPGFKNNSFPPNRRAAIIIDQHPPVSKPVADLAIIDTECGATSVILSQALLLAGCEIPGKLATSLAYGILTDTLNLYRAQSPGIINVYNAILPNCDMRSLALIQNPLRSRRFFATLRRGIHQAMVRRGLVISHLGPVESPDLVAQITDFLLTYKGIRWAFCTGRYKSKLYVSLRLTRAGMEASDVLRDIFDNRGDAGGHGLIGGGSFKISRPEDEALWEEVEQTFDDRLVKRLRIPAKSEFYYHFRKA